MRGMVSRLASSQPVLAPPAESLSLEAGVAQNHLIR